MSEQQQASGRNQMRQAISISKPKTLPRPPMSTSQFTASLASPTPANVPSAISSADVSVFATPETRVGIEDVEIVANLVEKAASQKEVFRTDENP